MKITDDFSVETLKAARAWSNTYHVLKDYDGQFTLIYPAKSSIIMRGMGIGERRERNTELYW